MRQGRRLSLRVQHLECRQGEFFKCFVVGVQFTFSGAYIFRTLAVHPPLDRPLVGPVLVGDLLVRLAAADNFVDRFGFELGVNRH